MNIEIKEISKAEKLYASSQSAQLDLKTGCIGHLRGVFANFFGNSCDFSWYDHVLSLNIEAFQKELADIISVLRSDDYSNGILQSRSVLSNFCNNHPAGMFADRRSYGFRIDTANYTYILRLNPHLGEYNYIHCYDRQMLTNHMQMAAGGIHFAGSNHEVLFTIKDGGRVIAKPKDTTLVAANLYCRYVDENSVGIGIGAGYPIAQLVDDLLSAGYTLSPAEKED